MPIPKRQKTLTEEFDESSNFLKFIFYAAVIWFIGLPVLGWTLLFLLTLVI